MKTLIDNIVVVEYGEEVEKHFDYEDVEQTILNLKSSLTSRKNYTMEELVEKIDKYFGHFEKDITKGQLLPILKKRFETKSVIFDKKQIETIFDTKTGFEWFKDFNSLVPLNWEEASKFHMNGFELPTIQDFQTLNILNREWKYPKKLDLEKIGFKNVINWVWVDKSENQNMTFNAPIMNLLYAFPGSSRNYKHQRTIFVRKTNKK